MEQSYKIFINDIIVILAEEKKVFPIPKKIGDAVIYNINKEELLKKVIIAVEIKSINTNLIIVSKDLAWLKKTFFDSFKILKAGGGVVFNGKKEVLLMHRKGKWDIPKGKIEKTETIKEGAVREVEEETGVTIKELKQKLGLTYHTYNLGNKWILKETHWFLMNADDNSELKPQKSEGIDKVIWCALPETKKYLKNSYSSIKDVFKFIP